MQGGAKERWDKLQQTVPTQRQSLPVQRQRSNSVFEHSSFQRSKTGFSQGLIEATGIACGSGSRAPSAAPSSCSQPSSVATDHTEEEGDDRRSSRGKVSFSAQTKREDGQGLAGAPRGRRASFGGMDASIASFQQAELEKYEPLVFNVLAPGPGVVDKHAAFHNDVVSLPRMRWLCKTLCQALEPVNKDDQLYIRDQVNKMLVAVVEASFARLQDSYADQEKALQKQKNCDMEAESFRTMKLNCVKELTLLRDKHYHNRFLEADVNEIQFWDPVAALDPTTRALVLACVEEKLKDTQSRMETSKSALEIVEEQVETTKVKITDAKNDIADQLSEAQQERDAAMNLLEEARTEARNAKYERACMLKRTSTGDMKSRSAAKQGKRNGSKESGTGIKWLQKASSKSGGGSLRGARRPSQDMVSSSDLEATHDDSDAQKDEDSGDDLADRLLSGCSQSQVKKCPSKADEISGLDLLGLLPELPNPEGRLTSMSRTTAESICTVERATSPMNFALVANYIQVSPRRRREHHFSLAPSDRVLTQCREFSFMKKRHTITRETESYQPSDLPWTELTLNGVFDGTPRAQTMPQPVQHSPRSPVQQPCIKQNCQNVQPCIKSVLSSGRAGIGWRKTDANASSKNVVLAVGSAIDRIVAEQRQASVSPERVVSSRCLSATDDPVALERAISRCQSTSATRPTSRGLCPSPAHRSWQPRQSWRILSPVDQ